MSTHMCNRVRPQLTRTWYCLTFSACRAVSCRVWAAAAAAAAAAVAPAPAADDDAAGKALMAGEGSRIQGLSVDLWTVSKGQKELKLVRPKGTVPCQVRTPRAHSNIDELNVTSGAD